MTKQFDLIRGLPGTGDVIIGVIFIDGVGNGIYQDEKSGL